MPFSLLILSLLKEKSSNSHVLGIWVGKDAYGTSYPATTQIMR